MQRSKARFNIRLFVMIAKNYFYKLGNRFPCVYKINEGRERKLLFYPQFIGEYSFEISER